MSKQINIDVGKWKGSVTIADPLTIPQAKLVEAGIKTPPEVESLLSDLKNARERLEALEKEGADLTDATERVEALREKRFSLFVYDDAQLPAVLACVEKWELSDFPEKATAENFPASPRAKSHKLVSDIFQELQQVYFGESEIPNE